MMQVISPAAREYAYTTATNPGSTMSVTYNGTNYYYATNIQGNVTAILNTSGTAVVQYTYDAWGNILRIDDTTNFSLGTLNPLRYRGYVYDTETTLYYLQSRYYNPSMGRFINADGYTSTGQGLLGNNMFAYCNNNPVKNVDSSGCIAVSATACAIVIGAGGIIGALTGAFAAASTGGNILEGAIEGLLTGASGAACGLFLSGPMAVLVGAICGTTIDVMVQGGSQYITTGIIDSENFDGWRIFKNGFLTGVGTLIPQWKPFGKASESVLSAIGTAVMWGEASTLDTCTDVVYTNTNNAPKDNTYQKLTFKEERLGMF